ncbi:MAG: matrixin family metalloprotease, partial [Nanoarchaeota archaeon]
NSTGEAGKMDFENIATHELGHSVGMGHPDSTCTEETMYAYADYGETKKRDLNTGDTAGINSLY